MTVTLRRFRFGSWIEAECANIDDAIAQTIAETDDSPEPYGYAVNHHVIGHDIMDFEKRRRIVRHPDIEWNDSDTAWIQNRINQGAYT